MVRPGAILLISCYELGHQPMALASAMAFLERAGFAATALDLACGALDEATARRARLIAISVPMHTALRLGVEAARRLRDVNPDCHICFYGLYALLNAEYLLGDLADSVLGGECEESLVELARALLAEDEAAERPEAATRDLAPRQAASTEARATVSLRLRVSASPRPTAPILRRLNFPIPSRRGLPQLDRYARLRRDGGTVLAGHVEASRGCRHLCLHCPIPPVYNGRFFVVPRDVVLEDIRRLVGLGAEHITFGDPDFLNGPGHSLRIVRALHAEFPGVSFDFTAKVEHLLKHRKLLPELVDCGCAFAVSAVESLSDTVLANLEKGHTRADVFELIDVCRGAGLVLRPSLVAFTPWTSLDDYLDVLDWVAVQGLVDCVDPVQYTVRLLVPPGSMLLERPAIQAFLEGLDQANFAYRWRHPDERMDRLQRETAALAEADARAGADAGETFARIRELAFGMHAARRPASATTLLPPDRSRPPRLTESWFC